ncbi:MAG: outer membrane protein assembly factor BamD [Candidatus Glassbacteria bacterium]
MISRDLVLIALLLLIWGCGQKNLPEDLTAQELFNRGEMELEGGDQGKAVESFQRIIYEFPGSEYVEKARLKLADARFLSGDYLLAANEYERFSRDFPLNPKADEALFKAAYSHEKVSEAYSLDQTETQKAISLYEAINGKYPDSDYADSATVRCYFLKDRLAKKTFENGYFYYKRELYDSAIIYFETMIEEYESSSWLAAAYFYLAKSYDKLKLPDEARRVRLKLLEEYPMTIEAIEVMNEFPELIPSEPAIGENTKGGGTG